MPTNTSTDGSSTGPGDPSFGLPRSARVTDNRDFRRIYARGRRASGHHLTVVALRRREPGHRVGLSVSKAHGCAVIRNKIKRIFREAFRHERPTLPGRYDVVMIPQRRPGKYLLPDVRRELRQLLQWIDSGKGQKRRAPRPPEAPKKKG